MNKNRARITGFLFIICTSMGFASVFLLGSITNWDTFLIASQKETSFITGAIMILIMAFTGAGISISIYPMIKDKYPALSIGSVVFRSIEGAMISIGSIIYIAMFQLHQSNLLTESLGNALLTIRPLFPSYSGAIAFGTGAIMYYTAFYVLRLVPRWLSLWGIVAVVLHIIAIIFVAFGHDPFAPYLMVLHLPIMIQEMVIAFLAYYKRL